MEQKTSTTENTTESVKPLYKRLNEQRTQGEYVIQDIYLLKAYDFSTDPGYAIFLDGYLAAQKPLLAIGETKEKAQVNAEYAALAINNLHILAEALEKISELPQTIGHAYQMQDIAKAALKSIS